MGEKRKYCPSNGTEGEYFMEKFCYHCLHDNCGSKCCDILMRSMAFSKNDARFPEEWTYDDNNNPICTNWVKWDWGRDGDPDNPDNPNYRPPDNPNQLCFPFIFDEIGIEKSKPVFTN